MARESIYATDIAPVVALTIPGDPTIVPVPAVVLAVGDADLSAPGPWRSVFNRWPKHLRTHAEDWALASATYLTAANYEKWAERALLAPFLFNQGPTLVAASVAPAELLNLISHALSVLKERATGRQSTWTLNVILASGRGIGPGANEPCSDLYNGVVYANACLTARGLRPVRFDPTVRRQQ